MARSLAGRCTPSGATPVLQLDRLRIAAKYGFQRPLSREGRVHSISVNLRHSLAQ
jgi:hypothetical protein